MRGCDKCHLRALPCFTRITMVAISPHFDCGEYSNHYSNIDNIHQHNQKMSIFMSQHVKTISPPLGKPFSLASLAVTVAVRGTLYSNAMQPKAWPANTPRDPTKHAAHLWSETLTLPSTANHPIPVQHDQTISGNHIQNLH